MKFKLIAATLLACAGIGFSATGASAQYLADLSGEFTCVQGCMGNSPGPVFVAQNGWTMNLVNEIGQPTRAWVDRPGHIWADNWQEGATYSPDGMTIAFDSGTVWQRGYVAPAPVLMPAPAPVVVYRHYHRHYYRPINGS